MLDESDPRPFKLFLQIYKYPDENGNIPVGGAFKFDNKEADDWSYLEDGVLQNGEVFFMVNDRGIGNHSLSYNVAPDNKEIQGSWQAYSPFGQIVMDREFVMTLIP